MKNNLSDLNNILFEELERLNDDTGDIDQEKEVIRAKSIAAVSAQVIEIGRLQLEAIKVKEEYGINKSDMTELLVQKDVKKIGAING